ncbi:MAG: alpha/beta hydrolase [Vicingaceae bacterium]
MSDQRPKTFQLSFANSIYHVEKYGTGSSHVLFFHGFGQRCDAVNRLLSDELRKKFTFHSFGLFFHQSSLNIESEPILDPQVFKRAVSQYLDNQNIIEVHLCGYSIGSRLCFSLIDHLKVKGLILFAPDGITWNPWYLIFTKANFIQQLILLMNENRVIKKIIEQSLKLSGYYSEYELKLIKSNAVSGERLRKVFSVWNCYMKFNRSWAKNYTLITKLEIPLLLIFGKKDRIVGKRAFIKAKKFTSQVILAEEGHDLLKNKYSNVLKDFLEGSGKHLPS